MAIHKLALLRYKIIDECLRNRRRRWTLEDLIEKVSEGLYEAEGISRGISRRTIQADLQVMRSNKLGYSAPIVVTEKKYYQYEDASYSISNSRITDQDLEKMSEVVGVLRALNGFAYFNEMNDIIARLEDSLRKSRHSQEEYIQLEGNGQVKGLEFIAPLYQAIRQKTPVLLRYQSFTAREPHQAVYHPYLLKEYRNRWFLIARPQQRDQLLTLALDRILEVMEMSPKSFIPYEGVSFDRYFAETIGVTKSRNERARRILIRVNKINAPYVITKPLHASQQVLTSDEDGMLIRIDVTLNFELEREILGFGEGMRVISPVPLREKIKRRLQEALSAYLAVEKK